MLNLAVNLISLPCQGTTIKVAQRMRYFAGTHCLFVWDHYVPIGEQTDVIICLAEHDEMMNNHGAADVEEAQRRPHWPRLKIINNRTSFQEGHLGVRNI